MPGNILSQAEVESLLGREDPGARGNAPAEPRTRAPSPARPAPAILAEKLVRFDVPHASQPDQEWVRALETLHARAAWGFAGALAALVRSSAEVKLASVELASYSQFISSLEVPTCLSLLRAEPLAGPMLWDMNPSILYPIIDRLLGGGRQSGRLAPRSLTEIELRLAGRVARVFLDEVERAWENVLDLDLAVVRVETKPRSGELVPPEEPVVVIRFELSIGDVRGLWQLCIPVRSIEPIRGKLAGEGQVTCGRGQAGEHVSRQSGPHGTSSLVELVVWLAGTKVASEDLAGLAVGDIVTTPHDIRTPLAVAVEGLVKFHAFAGALEGRKAIRVEQKVEPAQAAM